MAKKLLPVHPGEVLKADFMEPLGITAYRLAKDIGVTPIRISEIIRGKRGITADTAVRLAAYFGTDAQSWMNLQTHFDLETASDALGVIVAKIPRYSALAA
jgi:antitoxin HigA-1